MDDAERELANTAQLLSRHFDQELTVLQRIHDDVLTYTQDAGIDTVEAFERRMSTLAVHEVLRSKLQAFPDVGALNIFDTRGRLINSSQAWPVPEVSIVDRGYFKAFTSGRPVPATIVEAGQSQVTEMDHDLRAADCWPQQRGHRFCQPRRRAVALRRLLRLVGAGQRERRFR
jgi:hypothetical protein